MLLPCAAPGGLASMLVPVSREAGDISSRGGSSVVVDCSGWLKTPCALEVLVGAVFGQCLGVYVDSSLQHCHKPCGETAVIEHGSALTNACTRTVHVHRVGAVVFVVVRPYSRQYDVGLPCQVQRFVGRGCTPPFAF
jgi:hypothetical protein